MKRLLALLAALAAGCNHDDGILLVTVASPTGSLTLSGVKCHATVGAKQSDFLLQLDTVFTLPPSKTFAFDVGPADLGDYQIDCDGLDENSAPIAHGSVKGTLTKGARPTAEMDLRGCANNGVLLCDEFEGIAVDATRWDVSMENGLVAIDTTRAHHGLSSLHVAMNAGHSNNDVIENTSPALFDQLSDGYYLRFYAFFEPGFSHIVEIASFFQNPNDNDLELTLDEAGHLARGGVGAYSEETVLPASIQPGRWTCYEWSLLVPDEAHAGKRKNTLSIDGTLIDTRSGLDFLPMQGMWLGMLVNGGNDQPPANLWLDDVIIDSQPIGCDK